MRTISRAELRKASADQLKVLSDSVREEIFRTVSACGGHLSSNLGAVELTVALHRVFDFPRDKLIFDVGHQCYAHKLLSGRAPLFHTLRKEGGLSGFPKREESKYDVYGTGHAGTALSAALGLAKARDLRGEDYAVIALVGDGSFQNGLIYEALNSLKLLKTNVLLILNDNGMSISPTAGGMHEILEELKGPARERGVRLLEEFGLSYRGIVNGHDFGALLPALEEARGMLKEGSVLLHVATRKGQGYPFAENAPLETHGVSPVPAGREYAGVLGEELSLLAESDEKICAVTAAMTDSLGLRPFFERFPARAYDVGICEEHACVLAASLAAGGMHPYYAVYSTFLQRAYDEVLHDVCGQNLPVTFLVDRAGVTGADGETHQGVFDLSFLLPVPNLTVWTPKDLTEFRAMLRASGDFLRPLAIRYPRMGEEGKGTPFDGKFEVLHSTTSDIIVYAAGERCIKIARRVLERAQGVGMDFTLVNARTLKPLDREFLLSRPEKFVLTLEDNVLAGGFGDAVRRTVTEEEKGEISHFVRNDARSTLNREVFSFGYGDNFIPHGEVESLMRRFGLSEEDIFAVIRGLYARG